MNNVVQFPLSPGFDEDYEIFELFMLNLFEKARESSSANRNAAGECSLCNAAASENANFCGECGATFLTKEQIDNFETNSESSRREQFARFLKAKLRNTAAH